MTRISATRWLASAACVAALGTFQPPAARAQSATASAAAVATAPAAPSNPSPLADFLAQGKYAEGLEWLRKFGKGSAEETRYSGLFHYGLAQPDAALKDLVPAYRRDPHDEQVALALAEASLWKKDHRTATTVLAQLKAPEAAEALRVRGMLFEQAGRLPEALALYERAIPKLALPWGALERKAQVLSWLKRFDESAATYKRIIASEQASVGLKRRCRVRLAELTAWNKDFAGALAQLAKLLAEEPRTVEALLLRGQIEEWQGEFVAAKRTYTQLLAVDAGNAQARLRLNKLLWVQ